MSVGPGGEEQPPANHVLDKERDDDRGRNERPYQPQRADLAPAEVQAVEATQPQVVLMDLNMPRCNGVEATRRIRADHPQTKIVVLTTYSDDESILGALQAGALGYLTKDATRAEIGRAVLPPPRPGRAGSRGPAAAAVGRGPRARAAARARPGRADPPGVRCAAPHRGGQVQPGDSPGPVRQRGDGQDARQPDLRQDRLPRPAPRPPATPTPTATPTPRAASPTTRQRSPASLTKSQLPHLGCPENRRSKDRGPLPLSPRGRCPRSWASPSLIREWSVGVQAEATLAGEVGRGLMAGGGQAAGWSVTWWPRASSLAMSRRVSRSGSRRRVK